MTSVNSTGPGWGGGSGLGRGGGEGATLGAASAVGDGVASVEPENACWLAMPAATPATATIAAATNQRVPRGLAGERRAMGVGLDMCLVSRLLRVCGDTARVNV